MDRRVKAVIYPRPHQPTRNIASEEQRLARDLTEPGRHGDRKLHLFYALYLMTTTPNAEMAVGASGLIVKPFLTVDTSDKLLKRAR